MPTSLIFGVSGQDGSYLAQLLIENGYRVYGSSRDAELSSFNNLHRLKIYDQVQLLSASLHDYRSVIQAIIQSEPDEIYNLAGQSSVGLSFSQPAETFESISLANLNILESIRLINPKIKYYNASSSECFGDTGDIPATESSPFRPRSPYAVAKAAAFWQVVNYREAYGLYACSGILANHESPLRPQRFVTRKIVSTACRIARGSNEILELGNLKIIRDWGWAPEYVVAMQRMLQQPDAGDILIATGRSHRLEDFVELVFSSLNLDWRQHVKIAASLLRPTDIAVSQVNPKRASQLLDWSAKVDFKSLIKMMVDAEMELSAQS